MPEWWSPLLGLANSPASVILVVAAALVLYGGMKQKPWWVFGWVYRQSETRNVRMEVRIAKLTKLLEQALAHRDGNSASAGRDA